MGVCFILVGKRLAEVSKDIVEASGKRVRVTTRLSDAFGCMEDLEAPIVVYECSEFLTPDLQALARTVRTSSTYHPWVLEAREVATRHVPDIPQHVNQIYPLLSPERKKELDVYW